MENHVIWHNGYVNRSDRNRLNNHRSGLVWFTGLSASGKSTIAHHVEKELFNDSLEKGMHVLQECPLAQHGAHHLAP